MRGLVGVWSGGHAISFGATRARACGDAVERLKRTVHSTCSFFERTPLNLPRRPHDNDLGRVAKTGDRILTRNDALVQSKCMCLSGRCCEFPTLAPRK